MEFLSRQSHRPESFDDRYQILPTQEAPLQRTCVSVSIHSHRSSAVSFLDVGLLLGYGVPPSLPCQRGLHQHDRVWVPRGHREVLGD